MQPVIIGDATLSAIYKITNLCNGKVYIGSAINYKQRWKQHLSELRRGTHSPKMQAAWNKYGPDSFEFSIVEYVDDKATLIEREQAWIDAFNAAVDGLNCCPIAGSRLGLPHTDETKAKLVIKRAQRPSKPCSEETKRKISDAQRGRKKPPITDEHRAALSRTSKGRKFPPKTDEFKARIVEVRTGAKASEETKAKMTASHKARWALRKEAANGV